MRIQMPIPLAESLVILGLGAIVGLLANELSPRGLDLRRDYFPAAKPASPTPPAPAETPSADRLAAKGLQALDHAQVVAFYEDPRYLMGTIAFIDARDDRHYLEGHIPGAWQLDHYRMERYLPELLPVVMAAEQVVVYCNGGECEDSEFAAVILKDAGVPADRLFIYAGGITEWRAANLPIETGPRGSQLGISPPPGPHE